jgi:hypothetical protein
MNESQLDETQNASWWSRLTQAMFREPAIILLEQDGDDRSCEEDAPRIVACEGAR